MLSLTQLLIFESGAACNFEDLHAKCPSKIRLSFLPKRDPVPDATIIDAIHTAYRDLNFTGMVGFHYYNEPMLQWQRIKRIMEACPEARFIMWSNGTRLDQVVLNREKFAQVVISPYVDDPKGINLDNRMSLQVGLPSGRPCVRIFIEFVIDCMGYHHPCCADWKGEASLGNIHDTSFTDLARLWRDMQDKVGMKAMSQHAPITCRTCTSPFRKGGDWELDCIDGPSRDRAIEARRLS